MTPPNPSAPSPAEAKALLRSCLLLDLETRRDGKLLRLGAVLGDECFEAGEGGEAAFRHLDRFAERAEYLLGHNLLGHDLPVLERLLKAGDQLLRLPVIDTLYLSPLAFPENPYHRLVKDYRLVRQSVNDPVADARLAASLFEDQWQAFQQSRSPLLLSIFRLGLSELAPDAGGKTRGRGMARVLERLGAGDLKPDDVPGIFAERFASELCITALPGAVARLLAGGPDERAALAYAAAWLQVAGGDSVLPPWVRHRFPATRALLAELRERPCEEPDCAYCRQSHDPRSHLQSFFGFEGFRPEPAGPDGGSLQEAVVHAGFERRPLLAILPTGAGKSLCYQLPALAWHRLRGWLTVVLSPLQALMKDQVDGLNQRTGTRAAAALSGLLTAPERGEVLERIRLGDVAVLYVSPEQLRNRSFAAAIGWREIGCWVFDEAHCLSKWGHDFRPDYLYASRFIRRLAEHQGVEVPPVACFTATAKQEVSREIREHFHHHLGQELEFFEGGVERDNLHFEVQPVSGGEKAARIYEILGTRLLPHLQGCAIVYCATRRQTERLADFLVRQGLSVAAFHGGLPAPEKRRIQDAFVAGEVRVVCATNAFGLGIDKDDVRLVVHAAIPGTLESYLQEAGRAGRDRRPAECVLLYDARDVETQFRLDALGRLDQQDIVRLLRGLRHLGRAAGEDLGGEKFVVLTAGELLRRGAVDVSFDRSDRYAETRVRTAIAWLERAGLVERLENRTQVFQGRPLCGSLAEAEKRLLGLGVPPERRRLWLAILEQLINADPAEGLTADALAELPQLRQAGQGGEARATDDPDPSADTLKVLRTLQEMVDAGLLQQDLLLTAYIRHQVQDSSIQLLRQLAAREIALFDLLREQAPEAGEDEPWLALSLRRLNQRLVDDGVESSPDLLREVLMSATRSSLGSAAQRVGGGAGPRPGLELRPISRDRYRLRLSGSCGSWQGLLEALEVRRRIAAAVLGSLLAGISRQERPSAQLLVQVAAGDLVRAVRSDLSLVGRVDDPLAAVDKALLYLHENRVLHLQHGLAVFRQAMTLRMPRRARGRRYSGRDYQELETHYGERIFQVHVMNEFARLGLRRIDQALALMLAYFQLDRTALVGRFFAGREETLVRATSPESFEMIVTALDNPAQQAVVRAPAQANLLVLAGPGSGKTRVVVHRCAYLLRVLRLPAASLLVVCFNHNAAVSLRRRLIQLLGDDARGVTVLTYHGLAMRLTGASFAERQEAPDFDRLLKDAVALLEQEGEVAGLGADEVRERLLAGYRHVLVDEYQDVNEDQYRLIAAVTSRARAAGGKASEGGPSLLAVGDDDQNVYSFNGANVQYIRRFQEDYGAEVHLLVESYRCTAHILAAAQQLITANDDRMKTGHPIFVDRHRREGPPGGPWQSLDPLSRGRVQILSVADAAQQAAALVAEIRRLHRLGRSGGPESPQGSQWSDFAVLARTRGELAPIRAACEAAGVPVTWNLDRGAAVPLSRVREVAAFLRWLREAGHDLLRAGALEAALDTPLGLPPGPWRALLETLIEEWKQECGDGELPAALAADFLYESLAEQRRAPAFGDGVFLGTAHAAKGLEFDHVLIPGGGWSRGATRTQQEEERRVFYVAMTRARYTLCLVERRDVPHPHLEEFDHPDKVGGDALYRRLPAGGEGVSPAILGRRYEMLGPADLALSFAGWLPVEHPIHQQLSSLQVGSPLTLHARGPHLELHAPGGTAVARLSRAATRRWQGRLQAIEDLRVVAMIEQRREDSDPDYRERCRRECWEVPLVEIIYRAGEAG